MRYVIIRDDDTNALTPVDCLERLYRPFLNLGLPVNLAAIPAVSTRAIRPDGRPEGFLGFRDGEHRASVPLADNPELVSYLKCNPGFHILQHGLHHDLFEFDRPDARELQRRVTLGADLLAEAGFPARETFVAPYDKLSRAALRVVQPRFRVLSTGWFEWRRIPCRWWPRYLLKKLLGKPHWSVGQTRLLSHPGCLLSCARPPADALPAIRRHMALRPLLVLVTHWWEYFRDGRADEKFISALHETAHCLAHTPGVRVIKFSDLLHQKVPLN